MRRSNGIFYNNTISTRNGVRVKMMMHLYVYMLISYKVSITLLFYDSIKCETEHINSEHNYHRNVPQIIQNNAMCTVYVTHSHSHITQTDTRSHYTIRVQGPWTSIMFSLQSSELSRQSIYSSSVWLVNLRQIHALPRQKRPIDIPEINKHNCTHTHTRPNNTAAENCMRNT